MDTAMSDSAALLETTLDHLDQGVSLLDADLNLAAFNRRFLEILELSDDQVRKGDSYESVIRLLAERGEYGPGDVEKKVTKRVRQLKSSKAVGAERVRPNGSVIEYRRNPLPGGGVVTTYTDITERKEAARAAASAEAQLLNAIDNMSEGFVVYDADDRLVLCNEQFRRLYPLIADKIVPGVTFGELLQAGVEHRQIDGDDKDVARKIEARRAEHREPSGKPLVHQLSDGRWVQIVERRTSDGGVVGIRTDVTEFKEAEAALRATAERLEQRERFLSTIVDTIPAAINIRDTEGRYVLTNQTLADFYGVDLEDWLGTVPVLGHTESIVEVAEEEEFQRVVSTGVATVDTEYTYGPEGNEEHWLTTRRPIHEDGELRYVLTVSNEITERKRAEAALRDSERRFQTITANLPGAVYQKVLHPDGSIGFPYVSEGLRETHGCDPEAAMKDPDAWLDLTHPDDAAGLLQSNLDSVERMADWHHEYRIVTPDGETKWVRGHARIRMEPDGDIVWDGLVLDITEQRLAQDRIADVAKFPSENPNPVLRVSAAGAVLYANQRAHGVDRLFAGSRHRKLSKKLVAAVAEVARTGERQEPEFVSGDSIYCVALTPVAGESYINIYGRDITEERLAKRELAEKEALFRVALDSMPGLLVYTDEDLNIVLCNERFSEMYRAQSEMLQPGQPYADFLRYLAEHGYYGEGDAEALVAERVESLRNPSGKTFEELTPDGRVHRVSRQRVAAGGTVTVTYDITAGACRGGAARERGTVPSDRRDRADRFDHEQDVR